MFTVDFMPFNTNYLKYSFRSPKTEISVSKFMFTVDFMPLHQLSKI